MRNVTDKNGNKWEIEESPTNAASTGAARSPFDVLRATSGDREVKLQVMAGTLAGTSDAYLRDMIQNALDKMRDEGTTRVQA